MPTKPAMLIMVEDIDGGEGLQGLASDLGFLVKFANGSLFDGFAGFDLAAGKTPPPCIGRIGPTNQQDLTLTNNHRDGCRYRTL